jgi:hypothetical protein
MNVHRPSTYFFFRRLFLGMSRYDAFHDERASSNFLLLSNVFERYDAYFFFTLTCILAIPFTALVQSYQPKTPDQIEGYDTAFWSSKEYLQSVGFCSTHQASGMGFLFDFFFRMKPFCKAHKKINQFIQVN